MLPKTIGIVRPLRGLAFGAGLVIMLGFRIGVLILREWQAAHYVLEVTYWYSKGCLFGVLSGPALEGFADREAEVLNRLRQLLHFQPVIVLAEEPLTFVASLKVLPYATSMFSARSRVRLRNYAGVVVQVEPTIWWMRSRGQICNPVITGYLRKGD